MTSTNQQQYEDDSLDLPKKSLLIDRREMEDVLATAESRQTEIEEEIAQTEHKICKKRLEEETLLYQSTKKSRKLG